MPSEMRRTRGTRLVAILLGRAGRVLRTDLGSLTVRSSQNCPRKRLAISTLAQWTSPVWGWPKVLAAAEM